MAVIRSSDSANGLKVNSKGQALTTDLEKDYLGVYIAHSGTVNVLATAHAATAGFFWILNPLTSVKDIAIRRIEISSTATAVVAATTRITAERMTFTGTFTGTALASAKVDSAMPNPTGIFSSTTAGITPTAGAVVYGFQMLNIITAVGSVVPVLLEWEPNLGGRVVLSPGEGLVLRQPDAGITSDPRRLTINLAWDEVAV